LKSVVEGRAKKQDKLFTLMSPINKLTYSTASFVTLAVLVIVWCVLTYGGFVKEIFLPSPTAVMEAGLRMAESGVLWEHTWASIYRVGVGFLLAAALAIPLGILMGSMKIFEAVFEPLIGFIRYLPVTALIPLLILYLGIGELEKISVIFIGTFFQLVLMVADVTANVRKELLNTAYTLGASKRQAFLYVLLPATMPGIFDNLRITMGWAWTYLVVAELVGAETGLGFMILISQRYLLTDQIFFGLLVIGLLGVLTDALFKFAYRIYLPWSEKLEG